MQQRVASGAHLPSPWPLSLWWREILYPGTWGQYDKKVNDNSNVFSLGANGSPRRSLRGGLASLQLCQQGFHLCLTGQNIFLGPFNM